MSPGVDYLAGLGALDEDGAPRHRAGISTVVPGLGYVGLEWQRSFASATLRGAGADARYVLTRLLGQSRRLGVSLAAGDRVSGQGSGAGEVR